MGMEIKRGIAVSPGVAICQAVVVEGDDLPVTRRRITKAEVAPELEKLETAITDSTKELEELTDQAARTVGGDMARIFGFHIGMLQDPNLTDEIRARIKDDLFPADYATYVVMRRLQRTWSTSTSQLIKERVSDLRDIERRLLIHLVGGQVSDLSRLDGQIAIVAHDLTPSQTANLDRNKIRGLVTDLGGRTSHTAILAHALGIPAIVGLEDISKAVQPNETIIVDGYRGIVIIRPDASKVMEYKDELRKVAALEASLGDLRELPAETKDGTKINLQANIEFSHEVETAEEKGAEGVGLYRTEMLYLANNREPLEEEQYQDYVACIKALNGKPLTIRTLDLGADKVTPDILVSNNFIENPERNPFLGCRSIRLCLQNLPMFKTQLRAILRASTEGPVKIMFPLISSIMELRQAKMVLSDVMEDLEEQGIEFSYNIPIGMMIEVPSAAVQATTFAQECDFFSIGTNDLIQYMVAVDRSNERIASLYSAANPAVISVLKDVIRAAHRGEIDCSMCGEMASDPTYTMLLLGIGLRNFSITPPAIPEVKQIIRSVSIDQCKRVARKVASFESDRQIINYLRDELRKVDPDTITGRSATF